jgi:hypothetical protein
MRRENQPCRISDCVVETELFRRSSCRVSVFKVVSTHSTQISEPIFTFMYEMKVGCAYDKIQPSPRSMCFRNVTSVFPYMLQGKRLQSFVGLAKGPW